MSIRAALYAVTKDVEIEMDCLVIIIWHFEVYKFKFASVKIDSSFSCLVLYFFIELKWHPEHAMKYSFTTPLLLRIIQQSESMAPFSLRHLHPPKTCPRLSKPLKNLRNAGSYREKPFAVHYHNWILRVSSNQILKFGLWHCIAEEDNCIPPLPLTLLPKKMDTIGSVSPGPLQIMIYPSGSNEPDGEGSELKDQTIRIMISKTMQLSFSRTWWGMNYRWIQGVLQTFR